MQATAGSRPVKSSTSFNGHPGVSGAGGGKTLAPSPQGVPSVFPKGTNAGWIFGVFKLPAGSVGNVIAYGDSSGSTARYIQHGETATGSGIYRLGASSPTSPRIDFIGSPDPLPEYVILLGQWRSDGKVDLWINGTFVGTSLAPVTPYNTTAARFRLFAGAGASLGTPWVGEIGMWAVGAGDAEVADIQRAMGLGAWWYDLQEYLPEDHPYKHIAPWAV